MGCCVHAAGAEGNSQRSSRSGIQYSTNYYGLALMIRDSVSVVWIEVAARAKAESNRQTIIYQIIYCCHELSNLDLFSSSDNEEMF